MKPSWVNKLPESVYWGVSHISRLVGPKGRERRGAVLVDCSQCGTSLVGWLVNLLWRVVERWRVAFGEVGSWSYGENMVKCMWKYNPSSEPIPLQPCT